MSGISVNRLTNANVYVDGNNLLGRVQEIEAVQPHEQQHQVREREEGAASPRPRKRKVRRK